MAGISDKGWDLGGYLREQREHARLSVRQLANLAGVSNPYLSQVERGLRKPSAEVLQQIARGLRISAEALYVRAGILDGEGRPDVEAAVSVDPHLNDRQRRVLLDIYASFRAENRRAAAGDEPQSTPESTPPPPAADPATAADPQPPDTALGEEPSHSALDDAERSGLVTPVTGPPEPRRHVSAPAPARATIGSTEAARRAAATGNEADRQEPEGGTS